MPPGNIFRSCDCLWGSTTQIGIIRKKGFGEAGFESTPVFYVKAVGEASKHFLYFESVFHVHQSYFISGGKVAIPASVILPSEIIFRARSLFVFVQLDFGRRGEKRRA